MDAKRFRIEFVGEPAAGRNLLIDTIHAAGVNAVKVNTMLVSRTIEELDADVITFTYTDRWARDAPVVRPGAVRQARYKFDGSFRCHESVLVQGLTVR